MTKKSANDVIDRLKAALQLDSDSELCRHLDLNRAALGNWRSRDSVPYTLCVNVAEENKIDLNWLLTGEGTMLKGGGASNDELSERNRWLISMFNKLEPDDQDDAIKEIKKIGEISEMKKTLNKLMSQQGQRMAQAA